MRTTRRDTDVWCKTCTQQRKQVQCEMCGSQRVNWGNGRKPFLCIDCRYPPCVGCGKTLRTRATTWSPACPSSAARFACPVSSAPRISVQRGNRHPRLRHKLSCGQARCDPLKRLAHFLPQDKANSFVGRAATQHRHVCCEQNTVRLRQRPHCEWATSEHEPAP